MNPSIISILLSYLSLAGVGGVVVFWFWLRTRKHLLPIQRFRGGRWTGPEILLAVLTFPLLSQFVVAVLHEAGFLLLFYDSEPSHLIQGGVAHPLALPLALAGSFSRSII